MNLYKITQTVNTGYDTYSGAVVAAENEDAARRTHPSEGSCDEDRYSVDAHGNFLYRVFHEETPSSGPIYRPDELWRSTWALNIADVQVQLLGRAVPGTKAGVILADFAAG